MPQAELEPANQISLPHVDLLSFLPVVRSSHNSVFVFRVGMGLNPQVFEIDTSDTSHLLKSTWAKLEETTKRGGVGRGRAGRGRVRG